MDLVPVFVSLGSASFGYLAKAFVDSKLETKKQKEKEKQFKREKLERAFMILEDLNNKVTSINSISLRDGKYNSNELNMIIRFYFDNIHKEYSKYLNVAMQCLMNIKNQKLEENELQNYFKEYKEIVTLLVHESKKL